MLALVINELLLNALEHGFSEMGSGVVTIHFHDEGDLVRMTIHDTGAGLPGGFSLEEADTLGLRIVQTIVGQDLRGTFELTSGDGSHGTSASIHFRKGLFGE
jgi:two-component sensor histidine kinase